MNNKDIRREEMIMKISLIETVITASLGIVFFFILKSQAVLLDSLFSFTNVLLGAFTIWIIRISTMKASKKYNYGLIQARSLTQLFKSLIILAFLITSFIDSFETLFTGGRNIAGNLVFIYTVITVIFSFICIGMMNRIKGDLKSTIIKLEMQGWIQDTLITLAIGLGFAVTSWIKLPFIQIVTPFLDSFLVVVIVIFFMPSTLKVLIISINELLLGAPNEDIQGEITKITNSMCLNYDLKVKSLSQIKSDLGLFIDVELYIDSSRLINWNEICNIRQEISKSIKSKYQKSYIYVSFYPQEHKEYMN